MADETQQYADGFRAGYAVGASDGRAVGYVDAKARTYAAINACEEAGLRVPKALLDALRTTVGGTPS